MNAIGATFLLLSLAAILSLNRRWALVPVILTTCFMTLGQRLEFGPITLTIILSVLLAGICRTLLRGERPAGGICKLDIILAAWGAWVLASSAFHASPFATLITYGRIVAMALGTYYLTRCFIHDADDLFRNAAVIALALIPVAAEMVQEQITGRNLFAALGGVAENTTVRGDKLRASGPFAHGILAGTVGAASLPLMVALFRQHRTVAALGILACVTMVLASVSSGPLMSLIFSIIALIAWRWRRYTSWIPWGFVGIYLLLELVMEDPAYFIIARIDLTGSSTGWHRAELIRSAIEHLPEWWFAGADYTRHWMPTGVSWSEDHCDITNHYLAYGAMCGLPAMLLHVAATVTAFLYVGKAVRIIEPADSILAFAAWCLGASHFCHAASSMSVYYFDQSMTLLYIGFAIIASLYHHLRDLATQHLGYAQPIQSLHY